MTHVDPRRLRLTGRLGAGAGHAADGKLSRGRDVKTIFKIEYFCNSVHLSTSTHRNSRRRFIFPWGTGVGIAVWNQLWGNKEQMFWSK